MSSPTQDALTVPPSPHRPSIPTRAVTAPQLAAALEKEFKPDGTEKKKHTDFQTERYSSSSSSDKDDLDDLGPESTSESTSPSPSSNPPSRWLNPFHPSNLPTPAAWQTYFLQEVAGDTYLELQLLLMTLATGMLDSMTFTTYRVFASKQTGNTLFLALYAFRLPALPPNFEQNVGVSIGVFILGAAFFGHLGHISRQRRRVWLLTSNAFQALLMLSAAAIRYFVSRSPTGPGALAILSLLAFSASGQIANALNVAMPELNTTMVTGALIQLCTDRKIFALHNVKRNRRLAFFCAMLCGCFIGASIVRYRSPSAVLVVCAATKGAIFLSFFCNRGMVERRRVLEDGACKTEGAVTPVSRVLWGD
ncbi:hypothetical protein M409DRAFT_50841 [Zasmidium cellare ATCC 36951]|uniref:DUF1275 domain protein n=1 Tax=Zasmidium cellare ATCC 36951 TaxID=1080233 RepID=A0A6A6CW72_ZASCE|nr:uncharacterized protein M409DRAFT_50841 [Zasmidium cellare ATCC 36951]KAF2171394.1 hypothetical protein M409DRAFT_50841 [Zasmidium cellare ATCC 36951]